MKEPEVSLPSLPSPLSKGSTFLQPPPEGIFSSFKVSFGNTLRLQKKAMARLCLVSKLPSPVTSKMVLSTPHLCSPRKPMQEVIHDMENMHKFENQLQCIISLATLRQLLQHACTKCQNIVSTFSINLSFNLFMV